MNLCGRIRFHENSILTIISAVLLISASSVIAKGQSYQNTPFDLSTPTLPPGYLGYDPEVFVKTYQAVAAEEQQARQKSEFETTAAYEKRLKELGSQNTFTNNTYGFSAIPTSVSYNADAQTFTLQLQPKFASHNANYVAVLLESGAKDMGSYQAENGFGARFTVGKSLFFSYQVWFPIVQKPNSCAATITVPPAEAETMKPNIRALMVVKLVKPYVSLDITFSGDATFAKPYESTIKTGVVFGRLLAVHFYEQQTGRILASCP